MVLCCAHDFAGLVGHQTCAAEVVAVDVGDLAGAFSDADALAAGVQGLNRVYPACCCRLFKDRPDIDGRARDHLCRRKGLIFDALAFVVVGVPLARAVRVDNHYRAVVVIILHPSAVAKNGVAVPVAREPVGACYGCFNCGNVC